MVNELNEQNNFIMYTTDDGQVDIEVRLEEENVWLTQKSMAELFETTRNNITMHIKNIFEDGEWAILEWKDPLGLRGCGFFHIKNNLIVYQRGYWDKLSFLKQHNLPIE